jgi:hypothetical protein
MDLTHLTLINTNKIAGNELVTLLSNITTNKLSNIVINHHNSLTTLHVNGMIQACLNLEALDVRHCGLVIESEIVYADDEEEEGEGEQGGVEEVVEEVEERDFEGEF